MGRVIEIKLISTDRDYSEKRGDDRYEVHVYMDPRDIGRDDAGRKIISQANRAGADLPASNYVIDQVKKLKPGQSAKFRLD